MYGRKLMKMGRVKIDGLVDDLMGSKVMDNEGGFESGQKDLDIIFENGKEVEDGGKLVEKKRKMKNIRGYDMEKKNKRKGGKNFVMDGINKKKRSKYEKEVDEEKR